MTSNPIEAFLKSYKKKIVLIYKLKQELSGLGVAYPEFQEIIHQLMSRGILEPVAASGTNGKAISLAFKYRLHRAHLERDFKEELQLMGYSLDPSLSLDAYYRLGEDVFRADLPYIQKVNQAIKEKGLPDYNSLPEISLYLSLDEKWIEYDQGKSVLSGLGLWELLDISLKGSTAAFFF